MADPTITLTLPELLAGGALIALGAVGLVLELTGRSRVARWLWGGALVGLAFLTGRATSRPDPTSPGDPPDDDPRPPEYLDDLADAVPDDDPSVDPERRARAERAAAAAVAHDDASRDVERDLEAELERELDELLE